MVIGLGIDVCSVARVERILGRFGVAFWERILTPGEREDLAQRPDRAASLAGRFAAKEAAFKALGAPPDVFWHDLEIRGAAGKVPRLLLVGAALTHAERLGVGNAFVSITHDAGVAAAVVVLERSTR